MRTGSPSYVLIPIAYSLIIGESLGLVPSVGMVVIMLGLVLFCLSGMRGGGDSLRPIFLALGAAGLFGLAVVVLDIGSRVNIDGTLTLAQCPQVVVTGLIVPTARRYRGTGGSDIGILIRSGLAKASKTIPSTRRRRGQRRHRFRPRVAEPDRHRSPPMQTT